MRSALGVVFVALAVASIAAAAPNARVTITDSEIRPVRVRVDARGSVTWVNAGRQSHRVASRDGSFSAFTLAPRATRTVRFTRNGRHPYSVDGSRCAVVFVGVPLGAGCSGGGGRTAPAPPQGTRIYTYDVEIRGNLTNEGFVDDSDGRRVQTWTRTYAWTATFRNFKFKVIAFGSRFIGVNAAGRAVAGRANVSESWDYFWHPHALSPPNADCDGRTTGAVRAVLAVAVGSPTTPNYFVISQVPAGWTKDEEIKADCNGWVPPTTEAPDFRLPEGTDVRPDVGTLTIDFTRRTGGRRPPAGALAVGLGFRIEGTSTRLRPTCEGTCSGMLTMTQRYVIVFRPRR